MYARLNKTLQISRFEGFFISNFFILVYKIIKSNWRPPHTLLPAHQFDFSKAGREVALTIAQDSLQVILRAREQGAEDFSLYRMAQPLLLE